MDEEVDGYVLREAQRALSDLTRGRCDAVRTTDRDGRLPSHDAFHGYHCSQLAHTSTPTLDGALRAITELSAELHSREHEEEDTASELEEELEEAQADLEQAQEENRRLDGELGEAREELEETEEHLDEAHAVIQRLRAEMEARQLFRPHTPDPWDHEHVDAAERAAIEHEPMSVWTLLRRPAV